MRNKKKSLLIFTIFLFLIAGCSKPKNESFRARDEKKTESVKKDIKFDSKKYDKAWYSGMWVDANNVDMGNKVVLSPDFLSFSYFNTNRQMVYTRLDKNLDDMIKDGKIVLNEDESRIFVGDAIELNQGEYIQITPIPEDAKEYVENQKKFSLKILSSNKRLVREKILTNLKSLNDSNAAIENANKKMEDYAPNDWEGNGEAKEANEDPLQQLFKQKAITYEDADDIGKAAISESFNGNLEYVKDYLFLVYEDKTDNEVYLALMTNKRNPTVNGVVVYNANTFSPNRNISNVELKDDFGLLNEDMTIK